MIAEFQNISSETRKNRGFTLIELLTVIAVIVILISVLLPALGKAKEMTRQLVCKTHLRQIALAWHMYLNDNDGKFYQGINADIYYGGWEGVSGIDHPRVLNGYLSLPNVSESENQAKVFRCSSDKGQDTSNGLPKYFTHGTSYRTNHILIGPDQIPSLPSSELRQRINSRLKKLRINDVKDPSRLLLIGDNGWVKQWWPLSENSMAGWHGKDYHYNLAFLDCHVEFLHIRKGLYITNEYTVLPFKSLYGLARQVQVEEFP